MRHVRTYGIICTVVAAMVSAATFTSAHPADEAKTETHTSTVFKGTKANKGTVTHSIKDGKSMLTLSDAFVVPDTPAPHWQIVDSKGNAYLLQRLKAKGLIKDTYNQSITVPSYIHDIAKVQIWCAFAEVNLGEATFATPVVLNSMEVKPAEHNTNGRHTTSGFTGVKANTGSATHECKDGVCTLTLSADFKIPDAPAPHWQVVDSKGNTYLLQKLQIKGDKVNTTITVPSYVPDIAKVQIWCAYAQVLLGEASFDHPVQ